MCEFEIFVRIILNYESCIKIVLLEINQGNQGKQLNSWWSSHLSDLMEWGNFVQSSSL